MKEKKFEDIAANAQKEMENWPLERKEYVQLQGETHSKQNDRVQSQGDKSLEKK